MNSFLNINIKEQHVENNPTAGVILIQRKNVVIVGYQPSLPEANVSSMTLLPSEGDNDACTMFNSSIQHASANEVAHDYKQQTQTTFSQGVISSK